MFSQTLFSRARSLCLATVVGVLATGAVATSAEARTTTPAPADDAVIASANDTTIDVTSGAAATAPSPAPRSSFESGSGTITLNSSGPADVSPSAAPSATTMTAIQSDNADFDAPIVSSTSHHQSASRATMAQLQSGGPNVAFSGTPSVAVRPTHTAAARHTSPVSSNVGLPTRAAHQVSSPATDQPGSTIEVNVPGVTVYLSSTAVRRPSAPGPRAATRPRPTAEVAGSPASGLTGLLPNDPRPVPAPGGPANTTLFGSSSGSGGGSSLLGMDALFTFTALIVGAAWRRRSWDPPLATGRSALLSLALDRPG
jgi:hypothetical protein